MEVTGLQGAAKRWCALINSQIRTWKWIGCESERHVKTARMSSRFLSWITFPGDDSAVIKTWKMEKESKVQFQKVLVWHVCETLSHPSEECLNNYKGKWAISEAGQREKQGQYPVIHTRMALEGVYQSPSVDRSSFSLCLICLKHDVPKPGEITWMSKPIMRILFWASQSLHLPSHPLQQLHVVKEPDGNKIMRLKEISAIGILKNVLFSLLKRNRWSWYPLTSS